MVLILISTSQFVSASKTDDIKEALADECEKVISKKEARKLIKRVYLTCKSGSKVFIGGCEIDCMKKNTGSVLGGK